MVCGSLGSLWPSQGSVRLKLFHNNTKTVFPLFTISLTWECPWVFQRLRYVACEDIAWWLVKHVLVCSYVLQNLLSRVDVFKAHFQRWTQLVLSTSTAFLRSVFPVSTIIFINCYFEIPAVSLQLCRNMTQSKYDFCLVSIAFSYFFWTLL